jgi:hypothetical protein
MYATRSEICCLEMTPLHTGMNGLSGLPATPAPCTMIEVNWATAIVRHRLRMLASLGGCTSVET